MHATYSSPSHGAAAQLCEDTDITGSSFSLFDLLPDAIVVCDDCDRIIHWNDAAHQLYGWTLAEVMGKSFRELICAPCMNVGEGSERSERTSPAPEVHGGGSDSRNVVRVRKNGAQIVVTSRWRCVRVVGFDSPLTVITDREVSRRSATAEELFRSEETLRIACEGAGIGIWRRDVPTGRELWSPKYYELYGFDQTTVPSFENWLAAVHPDDRAMVLKDHKSMEEGQISELANEFRIVSRHGIRWIREIGRNFYDAKGLLSEMVGVAFDITELRRQEGELQRAAARKGEFLSMLAHELRNSLAVMVSAINLAEAGERSSEWTHTLIGKKVRALTQLIGDLLDLSRLTEGKIVLNRQRVKASPIIWDVIEQARTLFKQKRQYLYFELPQEEPKLEIDPIRFEQMMTNIIHNACKYTPPEGRITIELTSVASWVEIRVRDTGVGFPPEAAERLFELYQQLSLPADGPNDEIGSDAGMGIGLSVVRQLITMHGGTVVAESEGKGRGATFTLRFPRS